MASKPFPSGLLDKSPGPGAYECAHNHFRAVLIISDRLPAYARTCSRHISATTIDYLKITYLEVDLLSLFHFSEDICATQTHSVLLSAAVLQVFHSDMICSVRKLHRALKS
jgi:hypothetical protein